MTLRYPSALLLTATLAAGCDVRVGEQGVSLDVAHGRAEDEWTRTYTLGSGGRFEIVSGGGPVNVTASAGETIEVRIIREARASSDEAARQALTEETITEEVAPDRVKVQTTRPGGDNTGPLGRRRISTEYRVSIPAGLHVSIHGENADISLTGVQGQFTLENRNGGFRARDVSGSVNAVTVNGVIDVEMGQVTGDVRATTVNGPVRVGLPADVNATLEATSVNGVVTVDSDLPFTATTRERLRHSGQFGRGGPAIILSTTNGPVSIAEAGRRRDGRAGRGGEPVVLERQLDAR